MPIKVEQDVLTESEEKAWEAHKKQWPVDSMWRKKSWSNIQSHEQDSLLRKVRPRMGHQYEHTHDKLIKCPYCDKEHYNPPEPTEFFKDIPEGVIDYGRDCFCGDDSSTEEKHIKCPECNRMFLVSYDFQYSWWSSKAIPCKEQNHEWWMEPNITPPEIDKREKEMIIYRCTKCSGYLFPKRNEDGTIPTPEEWTKGEKTRAKKAYYDHNKEDHPIIAPKKVMFNGGDGIHIYCDETIGIPTEVAEGNHDLFTRIIKIMKAIGFKIDTPNRFKPGKQAACLAHSNRYCNWKELECDADYYPAGMKFAFYQNVVYSGERKDNRGQYESNKWKLMPYLTKKKVIYTNKLILAALQKAKDIEVSFAIPGHEESNDPYGKGYGWHGDANPDDLKGKEKADFIRQHPYKGDKSHYGDREGKDANGIPVESGDMKYTYIDGRLWYGQFHYRSGSYGYFITEATTHYVAEYDTFNWRDNMQHRWFPDSERKRKMERELERQIKAQNFTLCAAIKKQIDLMEITNGTKTNKETT